MARQVIYEDEEIIVVFYEGDSEFTMFTFGDMVSLAAGTRFYADVLAVKYSINTVGFMAKRANWFPKTSMTRAIAATQPFIVSRAERVSYGGSMGGYAAIKYSASLSIKTVIAFCPQWSIDPEECSNFSSGYEACFSPEMSGMGIKDCDINGEIFLFFDPAYSTDRSHFNRILSLQSKVHPVKVYASDHHVTSMLAGSETFAEILKACRSRDIERLRRVVSETRRSNPLRTRVILRRALERHPRLIAKITESISKEMMADLSLPLSAIRRLCEAGHSSLASRILQAEGEKVGKSRRLSIGLYISKYRAREIVALHGRVESSHGTTLFYDALTNKLQHRELSSIDLSAGLHLLTIVETLPGTQLRVLFQGDLLSLQVRESGEIEIVDGGSVDDEGSVSIEVIGDGRFHLKSRSKYLCADPSGVAAFDRTHPEGWEKFRTSRMQDQIPGTRVQ